MFGNNKVTKQDLAGGIPIKEVFQTIQGEGPYAGQPALFIRVAGCNLRCYFCDTDFELTSETPVIHPGDPAQMGAFLKDIQHLMSGTGTFKSDLIVITGGEPLLYNIAPLVAALLDCDYRVQIETAGTVWSPGMQNLVDYKTWGRRDKLTIVCSPKTPKLHEAMAQAANAWKYVVRTGCVSATDGLPICGTQSNGMARVARPMNNCPVYIQPMDMHDQTLNVHNIHECTRVAMLHGYIVSLQQHKLLGVE